VAFRYEVVTFTRRGARQMHGYASEDEIVPGSVVVVDGRHWLMERVEPNGLLSDLERFRADIEGDHDEIEEWDFRGGRIFASVGSPDDKADPDKGHGWMCRLVDSGVLAAAGFERVRKTEL
jgi:hypothetical protein